MQLALGVSNAISVAEPAPYPGLSSRGSSKTRKTEGMTQRSNCQRILTSISYWPWKAKIDTRGLLVAFSCHAVPAAFVYFAPPGLAFLTCNSVSLPAMCSTRLEVCRLCVANQSAGQLTGRSKKAHSAGIGLFRKRSDPRLAGHRTAVVTELHWAHLSLGLSELTAPQAARTPCLRARIGHAECAWSCSTSCAVRNLVTRAVLESGNLGGRWDVPHVAPWSVADLQPTRRNWR